MYRCWGHGQVKPQCDEKKLHYSFQWAKKEPVFFLMKNRVWNSHGQDYRACIFHSAGELLSTLLLCLRGIMWLWAEICWNVKTALTQTLWFYLPLLLPTTVRVLTEHTSDLWDQFELLLTQSRNTVTHPNGSPTTRNATSVTSASSRIWSAPCSTRSLSARISCFP